MFISFVYYTEIFKLPLKYFYIFCWLPLKFCSYCHRDDHCLEKKVVNLFQFYFLFLQSYLLLNFSAIYSRFILCQKSNMLSLFFLGVMSNAASELIVNLCFSGFTKFYPPWNNPNAEISNSNGKCWWVLFCLFNSNNAH